MEEHDRELIMKKSREVLKQMVKNRLLRERNRELAMKIALSNVKKTMQMEILMRRYL